MPTRLEGGSVTLRPSPVPSSISLPAPPPLLYHYDDAKGAEKIDVATKGGNETKEQRRRRRRCQRERETAAVAVTD